MTRKPVGEPCALSVSRDGALFEATVRLAPARYLVPRIDGYDCEPSFLIVGGLVFVPLTRPWCEKKKQEHLFLQHCGAPLAVEGEQVVSRARALVRSLSRSLCWVSHPSGR